MGLMLPSRLLALAMQTLQDAELCFPLLLNSSCRRLVLPQSTRAVLYVFLLLMSLLTVLLNLTVIISISHFRQLHTATNIILLSLAVSDFIIGFRMSFQVLLLDGCWLLGDLMCRLVVSLDYIVIAASIGAIMLISIDRYLAICDPMHYLSRFTLRRVKVCVCVCWLTSALGNSLLLKGNVNPSRRLRPCIGQCVVAMDQVVGLVDILVSFIIPVSLMIILYLRVFLVVVSQARAIRSQVTTVTVVKVQVKKSELKAARTLGVVVVVFLICLCPYFAASFSGEEISVNAATDTVLIGLFYFNSCLNPIIYTLFYPWFRKSMRLIISLQILRPGSSDTHFTHS